MDLWLRALAALPEDHAGDALPPTCASVPEKLMLSPGLHRYPHMLKYTRAQTCIQIKKINLLQKYLGNNIRFLKINS